MCRSCGLVNRNAVELVGAGLAVAGGDLVAEADPAELGVTALQDDRVDGHGAAFLAYQSGSPYLAMPTERALVTEISSSPVCGSR
jgi:hypothetical protein